MSFQTTQQQEELRAKIRAFAEEEIKPLAFLLDKENEFPEDAVEKLGSMGLMGIPYPKEYGGMYGNTEAAAQALAARLCEKGQTNVAVYDVSSTDVSQLISESFKYSHLVLASVTYNLGIYPAMHNFLMDMKALNVQNRTVALIENGSWACKSGDLMQKFINDELKNMTVLNERVSMCLFPFNRPRL